MLGRRDRHVRRGLSELADLDGYEEVRFAATGGAAIVYRAREPAFDRDVAIKVLHNPVRTERERARFNRELRITGGLTGHPHIVIPLRHGVLQDGRPWVSTPWYAGGSLADHCVRPMPVTDVLRIGVGLAGALATAHRAGVIHRDVKPQNVLLDRAGSPALADFGTAVLTGAEQLTLALTPLHAAPEVLDGKEATSASDIWSLGSTLWTCLAGRAPYAAPAGESGALAVMRRIWRDPLPALPRDDVPEDLVAVLSRCLDKVPAQREGSAEGVAQELRAVQARLGQPVTPVDVRGGTLQGSDVSGGPGAAHDPRRPQQPHPLLPGPLEPDKPRGGGGLTQVPPDPDDEGRREDAKKRVLRRVLAACAGTALALLAALWVLGATVGDPDKPTAGTATSDAPASESSPVPPETVPLPASLQAAQQPDGSVELTWEDPNGGQVAYVVAVYSGGQQVGDRRPARSNGVVVGGLQPDVPYCFRLDAVVGLDVLEPGPARCLNGDQLPAAA